MPSRGAPADLWKLLKGDKWHQLIPILCVAAWVSCTGAPNQDGGVDPGADVGNDTGLDTRATETGPSDASGLDPGWVSIADGLPSFCSLERANHPERLDQLRVHLAPCAVRDNCMISEIGRAHV